MKENEFKCDVCKHVFTKAVPDAEAEAELKEVFDVPVEECDLVCDGCYQQMGF